MSENEIDKLVRLATESTAYRTDRAGVAVDVIKAHQNKEVAIATEKYKIDKMIENGLIGERSESFINKQQIIDYSYNLLKDNRFWIILAFILALFNSSRFWDYMFATVK